MRAKRVVVIGLDGLDPTLTEAMMRRGELPHLSRLRERGGYARMATTLSAQTPVAWSSFAVGANPGAHGIYDFLRRDPATYQPDIGLYRYEQKSRFLPPRAVNRRGGTPVWQRLSDAGLPSVVLRHPVTYPPDAPRGRMLAGVGVPDLRGGFGTSSYYTAAEPTPAAGEGEHVYAVRPDASGRVETELLGPRGSKGEDARLPLRITVDAAAGSAGIACGDGDAIVARMDEWTPWVPVRFRLGMLQSVRGLVRFLLRGTAPLALFASPVHFDPEVPVFPISHPWDYAAELRRALGPYATLGMAEDYAGLNNGRLSEQDFLRECDAIMRERRAMMRRELARREAGLFYILFDTPDRIQHMFWRFRDPGHPANRGEAPPPELARVIEDHYRECDAVVGQALELAGDDALLMVASDHGFTTFRRELHLNAWLARNGYLALKPGVEPGDARDLLRDVDWSRTRAYALGLAGLFLNLRGREAEGIVAADAAPALRAELAERLTGLRDPGVRQVPAGGAVSAQGDVAIRGAFERDAVYAGPYVDEAPDVLVACAPGWRVSGATATGGVGAELFGDNRRAWSGDHIVDPGAVPGVLFLSAPFRTSGARIIDLAPTILDALGAPGADAMEGASLLS